ncbi:MAG: chromosome segregation protein SMC [Xanthomonadales bacterium]
MRLSSIKMAGFKSFVDPTTFHAPSNLIGVVGPNGCGKSNIIDDVRCVMGEGSAKVLRGESMADVIFSGSSGRKPVGTATVELIFDNSEGHVGGQYAAYNEISLKRQVSRDGVSVYYLNGSRCRRKDVRDLLLGTGLGSRSYSIIEQGMISEVVEARPEEIRGHLEEAAGISKYKERRRETERRINHTRDNLERLADLREEVGKHLNRLKRQASAANRYRKLKQEKREMESRLMTLRWRKLMERVERDSKQLAKQETSLQESIARQRASEAALEKLHQEQGQCNEAFSEVQGELYRVGSDIARLEQTIVHARELHKRQQQEFEETEAALKDLEKHMGLDKVQVEELIRGLAEVEPALAVAVEAENKAVKMMEKAEGAVQVWQKHFEQHHLQSTQSNRVADRTRADIEVLDQRMMQASRRLQSLSEETAAMDASGLHDELEELSAESLELIGEEQKRQAELDELRSALVQAQSGLRSTEEKFRQAQRELHTREGRLASLQALQEAALEDQSGEEWLDAQGLADAPRLAQFIQVEAGWETAVETVLTHWLQSVVTPPGMSHGEALGSLENASLDLIEDQRGRVKALKGTLAAVVDAPDAVIDSLNRVKISDSLEQAWSARGSLAAAQSYITRSGEWIGQGWARVARGQPGQDSMLAREKTISRVDQEITQLNAGTKKLGVAGDQARSEIQQREGLISAAQAEVNALHRKRSEVDGQLESRQSSITLMAGRQQNISGEISELRQQIKADESAVSLARGELEKMLTQMAGLKDARDALDAQRGQLMAERDSTRRGLSDARDKRYDLALRAESRRASLDSLQHSLQRMDTQISQLQQRYLSLSEQLAKAGQPDQRHSTEMEALLQRRLATEARLGQARAKVQTLENDYREKDADRQRAIQNSDEIRQNLETARLQLQEIQLNARSIQQQVEELEADVNELVESLPEGADPAAWETELENLQIRITRLEPVNLAAIQEFEEERKRKDYMDEQNDDLCDALQTLENAIAKIDRKTRTRFKDTFEKVNKGVQELFPRLFGGGHAYLELTGEDLLTTGVSIMAQPPGKRVSSLHLLSGGEKALTAVAFVFAIFRLNPAPFCMLDEVDAPLDDANVARFCSLVKEMAEKVQFIFVTHNKITMEMADQMSGVTMSEPGVSRLVQVDVDAAAKLAGT